jgi:hypothetical protein
MIDFKYEIVGWQTHFLFFVKYFSSLMFGKLYSHIYSQYHNTTDEKHSFLKITAFFQAIHFGRWVAMFQNQVPPLF